MKLKLHKGELYQLDDKTTMPKDCHILEYEDTAVYDEESKKSYGTIYLHNQDYWEAKILLQEALFNPYWNLTKMIIAGVLGIILIIFWYLLWGLWKTKTSEFNVKIEAEKKKLETMSPAFIVQQDLDKCLTEKNELINAKTQTDEKTTQEINDRIQKAEQEALNKNNELQALQIQTNACNTQNWILQAQIENVQKASNSEKDNCIIEKTKIQWEYESYKKSAEAEKNEDKFKKYVGSSIIDNCKKNETQMCKDLYFNYKNTYE